MFDFEQVINRLIDELELKNKSQLAKIMNVSTQVMGNWKSRNKIPFDEILTLCLIKNIDIKYIFSGKKEEKISQKIDFKEEIHQMIDKLDDKKSEIYYHLIKAEILKGDL